MRCLACWSHIPAVYGLLPRVSCELFRYEGRRTAFSGRVGAINRNVLYWRVASTTLPVVLLKNVIGVGTKGDMVYVKRGYARHVLFPRGLAVAGTWENIDNHATIDQQHEGGVIDISSTGSMVSECHSFDWVDSLVVRLHCRTVSNTGLLEEPVSLWRILQVISEKHHLDLLPQNIVGFENNKSDMNEGITHPGIHRLSVLIPFKSHSGKYTISVKVVPHP
eukprot:GHVQ01014489.1.p1 GENE.GHVQ01014489.1~~GHVQ01014489.1.p1  ORF type:complete len:221 (+),score=10.30 GHVQ01014489.1:208-870(+)